MLYRVSSKDRQNYIVKCSDKNTLQGEFRLHAGAEDQPLKDCTSNYFAVLLMIKPQASHTRNGPVRGPEAALSAGQGEEHQACGERG